MWACQEGEWLCWISFPNTAKENIVFTDVPLDVIEHTECPYAYSNTWPVASRLFLTGIEFQTLHKIFWSLAKIFFVEGVKISMLSA